MHTVFSGNGERESQGTPTAGPPAPQAAVSSATHESDTHFANCDLCDSRIRGARYVSFQPVSVISCNQLTALSRNVLIVQILIPVFRVLGMSILLLGNTKPNFSLKHYQ